MIYWIGLMVCTQMLTFELKYRTIFKIHTGEVRSLHIYTNSFPLHPIRLNFTMGWQDFLVHLWKIRCIWIMWQILDYYCKWQNIVLYLHIRFSLRAFRPIINKDQCVRHWQTMVWHYIRNKRKLFPTPFIKFNGLSLQQNIHYHELELCLCKKGI